MFLKILQNSHTCARIAFLIKLLAWNFIKKETLTQAFSRKFCKIFKNTFFFEHHRWLLLYILLDTIGFVVLGFIVLVLHCPHNRGHLPRTYELLQLLSFSLLQWTLRLTQVSKRKKEVFKKRRQHKTKNQKTNKNKSWVNKWIRTKTAIPGCFVEKLFWKISQNSEEHS